MLSLQESPASSSSFGGDLQNDQNGSSSSNGSSSPPPPPAKILVMSLGRWIIFTIKKVKQQQVFSRKVSNIVFLLQVGLLLPCPDAGPPPSRRPGLRAPAEPAVAMAGQPGDFYFKKKIRNVISWETVSWTCGLTAPSWTSSPASGARSPATKNTCRGSRSGSRKTGAKRPGMKSKNY